MEMDIKNLTSYEIIDLIRTRRRIEHSITAEEKKALLKELFQRGDENLMCDSTLHDVLYSILPVSPNGNERLKAMQIKIASKMTDHLNNDEEQGLDWTDFPEDAILNIFNMVNDSSRPSAPYIARTLYEEIWYREIEEKVSESTLYNYIRNQIPPSSKEEFRSFAEELVKFIINI